MNKDKPYEAALREMDNPSDAANGRATSPYTGEADKVAAHGAAMEIKTPELCRRCAWGTDGTKCSEYKTCKGCPNKSGKYCLCLTVKYDTPCPYFEEERAEMKQKSKHCRKDKAKRTVYLLLLAIFIMGLLIGLFLGVLVFRSDAATPTEETVQPTTEPEASAVETLVIVPTDAPTEAAAEAPTTPTEPEIPHFDVPLSNQLQEYIWTVCGTYNVPYELVIAMMDVESGFQADVISPTADYGLMQINQCNHDWLREQLGIRDFLDPEQNVLAGVYILSTCLNTADGNMTLALMCYNCGAGEAQRLWRQGVYSTSYTDKVMAAYETYRKGGETE